MELHNFLIVLLLLLVLLLSIVQAEHRYHLGQSTFNNRTIMIMNNKGLTGSYAGYQSNTTAQEGANIEYSLWFTNTTEEVFTLSLVAHNVPAPPVPDEMDGWVWKDLQAVVIWAANPNNSVERQATFNVNNNGNLELMDENGTQVWETKTGDKHATDLYLTDGGTVELRKINGEVVWQSSDYPTDTLMQNQVLKSGKSLKSSKDYSSTIQGPYSLALDEVEGVSLVYVTSTEKQIYWTWNGAGGNYSGLTLCNNGQNLFLQLQSSQNLQHGCASTEAPATWRSVSNLSEATRYYETFLKLEPDGDVSVYAWESTNWTKKFSLFANQPCGLPMKCGAYGLCQEGSCKGCIQQIEYSPENRDEVCTVLDATYDCRKTTLTQLDGYEYFATNYSGKITPSPEVCRDRCTCDVNCKAAFYRDIGNGSGGYCFITSNIGTIQNVIHNTPGAIAFLRVPNTSKQRMKMVIVGSVAAALVGLFIARNTVHAVVVKNILIILMLMKNTQCWSYPLGRPFQPISLTRI